MSDIWTLKNLMKYFENNISENSQPININLDMLYYNGEFLLQRVEFDSGIHTTKFKNNKNNKNSVVNFKLPEDLFVL